MTTKIITEEKINNLGSAMTSIMRIANLYGIVGTTYAHELAGMEFALITMGFKFEYEFNKESDKFTAVTIEGIRFEV